MHWCSRMRIEKLGDAQDVIVEDLPKKKKSQWMVILLSNDENCPRSLKINQCPFPFIFLSATQIFQGILMFLYSSKQAARFFQCLGCAVHCILASHKLMSPDESSFHMCVIIILTPTLGRLWQFRKNWGPNAVCSFFLLLLCIFITMLWRKRIYSII